MKLFYSNIFLLSHNSALNWCRDNAIGLCSVLIKEKKRSGTILIHVYEFKPNSKQLEYGFTI